MKKTGAVLVVIALLGVVAWLGVSFRNLRVQRLEAVERRVRLPETHLVDLQDAPVLLRADGRQSVVLVLFTTTCEYCRAELRAFSEKALLFKEHKVFFVAWEEADALQAFAGETGIDAVPWFRVLRDTVSALDDTLGIAMVPTTFVYGPDGRLRDTFEGIAAIESIAAAARGKESL